MQPFRSAVQGFSLIEMLIVISILGMLFTVVVVNLENSRMAGRDAQRRDSVDAYTTAFQEWRAISPNKDYQVTMRDTTKAVCWSTTSSFSDLTRRNATQTTCSSIADALVDQGVLNKIQPDPLDANLAYTAASTHDFKVGLFNNAKDFVIFAQLERPNQSDCDSVGKTKSGTICN